MKVLTTIMALLISMSMLSCSDSTEEPTLKIGTELWPGFEFLQVAKEQGFFEAQGLNIELVQLGTLSDVARLFTQKRIDGMANSMSKTIDVIASTDLDYNVVSIIDFSTGADVIIANKTIKSVKELKGKTVETDLGWVGSFVLLKALEANNLTYQDITHIHGNEFTAYERLATGEVDAIVTYFPYSAKALESGEFHAIYSTAKIPESVIDLFVLREGVVNDKQAFQKKFLVAWEQAINYVDANKKKAYQFMAEIENVSLEEFEGSLEGLTIIPSKQQAKILNSELLTENILEVCRAIKKTDRQRKEFECEELSSRLGVILPPE